MHLVVFLREQNWVSEISRGKEMYLPFLSLWVADRAVAYNGCFCQWCYPFSGHFSACVLISLFLTIKADQGRLQKCPEIPQAHKANKHVEIQRSSSCLGGTLGHREGGPCCSLSPRTAVPGNGKRYWWAASLKLLPGPQSAFPSGIFFIWVECLLCAHLFEELFYKVNWVLLTLNSFLIYNVFLQKLYNTL